MPLKLAAKDRAELEMMLAEPREALPTYKELQRQLADAQKRAERAEAACAALRMALRRLVKAPSAQYQCFAGHKWTSVKRASPSCPVCGADGICWLQDLETDANRIARIALAAPGPNNDLMADARRVAQAAMERCAHRPDCAAHDNPALCDCTTGMPLEPGQYEDVIAIIKRRGWDRRAEGEGEE